MSRSLLLTLPLCSGLLLTSMAAHGAGFALIEHSASGMGNAYAGAAAIAEDGSTIYFNPAGMTELGDEQISGAIHWVRPRGDFTNSGSSTASGDPLLGDDSRGQGIDGIIPNLYYSKRLESGVMFGFGINVPYGMETSYNDDWVGRYHAVKSKVMSVNFNPSLAWQVNDKLSLGAGINGQYIHIELSNAIDFGSICSGTMPAATCAAQDADHPQQRDGFAELEADGFNWGYNVGLLYKLQPETRVGFSYRSKITHDVKGDADFTVPSSMAFLTAGGSFVDTGLRSTVTLPESTSLSFTHQIDRFTLLFDWSYTRWSRFKELRIEYDSAQADSVTTENWQDSRRYAVGLNYQLSSGLLLRSGIAYDETPIPDEIHRTPRIPGSDRLWVALGFGYQIDNHLSIDVGYAHLFVDDSGSDHSFESSVSTLNHTLSGEYEATVNILSAQLNWSF